MAPAAIGSQELEKGCHRRPSRSAERGSLPGAGAYTRPVDGAGWPVSAAGGDRIDDPITFEEYGKPGVIPAGDGGLAHGRMAIRRSAKLLFDALHVGTAGRLRRVRG